MSISIVETISINGSQAFLGGQIYNLRFSRGFNGQPSTIEANIIAESAKYEVPELNFTSPYHINIGNTYTFDFFAYKYCISDSSQGRLLTVSFKDGVNKLSRYWISPYGQVCYNPNVIFCGSSPNSLGTFANQTQGVVQSSSTVTRDAPFGSYNYYEFYIKTKFLGIPNIKSNNLVRITQEGTVLDIFNYFMNLYGYTWYIEGGSIKLIDIKNPVVIDSNLITTLESHPKRLSSNMCIDNDNNYVRGAVALQDAKNSNDPNSGAFLLSSADALWDGTDTTQPHFLGVPLLGVYGPKAALYALHSPQLYFAYIFKNFGVIAALQALGYSVYESYTLNNVPSTDLQKNQTQGATAPFTVTEGANVGVYVCKSVEADGIQSAYERDRLLGDLLSKGYYTIQDANSSAQWEDGSASAISANSKVSEVPQLNTLAFDTGLVREKTSQNVWLLSYPVSIDYSALNDTQKEMINGIFPQKLPFSAKLAGKPDDGYFMVRVNMNGQEQINVPNLQYSSSSVRYVKGNLSSTDLRFGTVSQKDIPIYGVGNRRIIACNIPAVKPETSNIEIVTFENLQDEVADIGGFIAHNTYSKNNPDVQYEINIRGINLGFVITPEQGLENISISLDENGYTTSYQLSSRRQVPPNPESLKGLYKQFSSIT